MVTIECETLDEGLLKVARQLGSEILTEGSRNLVEGNHVDTGQLLQSGELVLTSDGCTVRWGLDYADFVEFGREAGSPPPFEPIHDWCKRRLGIKDPEAKNVAWAIINKIDKEGIDPVSYARNAVDAVIRKYSG